MTTWRRTPCTVWPSARMPATFRHRRSAARGAWRSDDDDVVRPLDVEPEAGRRLDAVGQRHARGQRQQARPGRRRTGAAVDHVGRPQHDRHVEAGPRRREPGVAAPAAARRLRVGDDDGALGSAPDRERGGRVVGRTRLREVDDPRAERRQPRGRRGEPGGDVGRRIEGAGHRSISISKLMSAAGAECVSAPTDTKSAPVAASSGMPLERHAAGDLDLRAPARAADGLAHVVERQVVEQDRCRRRPRAPRRPRRGSAPRPRSAGPGAACARADTAAATPPASRMWLSLIRIASYEPDAMVRAAAGADRVLLERAQRRRRLARVEDRDAAAGGVDEAPRRAWRCRTAAAGS